jgi:hypothetical protein
MTPMAPDPRQNPGEDQGLGSLADQLKQESDRLRQLAEQLQARQEALSEMEANYPYFRKFVYAKVREEFERTLPELPDRDLEILAQEEDAQPLEAFIEEIERLVKGP